MTTGPGLSAAPQAPAQNARSSVSRNAMANIVGSLVPLVITLVTVPAYLRLIGDTRFGVLALVWVLLSYFSLFEMGLGRATSKYIAELVTASDETRSSVFWTALAINAAMGAFGGLVFWLAARPTLPMWLKADANIQAEVANALPWLAAAVPLATVTSVLMGGLEGREQFVRLNSQQVMATVLFQLAPLAVAYWHGPNVAWLIAAAFLARLAANLPLFVFCRRFIPLSRPQLHVEWVRRLFSYGAWITVSGIVNPILSAADRFLIALVSGAQALTYYSIPYNFATRLWILPGSVARALFPRFSAQNAADARDTAGRAVVAVGAVLTPVVAAAILAARPFFTVWLGSAVADRTALPAEILLVSIWINSMAHIPYGLLQAQGRPDLTAKFHVAEVLPFMAIVWVGVKYAGVPGGATAWGIRVLADALLLFGATRLMGSLARSMPGFVLVAGAFVASLLIGRNLVLRAVALVVAVTASLAWGHSASAEFRDKLNRNILSQIRLRMRWGTE